MNMDLIKAIFYAGLPVLIFTFLMVYYAYQKGYLISDVNIRDAFKDKNSPYKKLSKANKKNLLFLHSKWVVFGGGFYGLLSLLIFIYIELEQAVQFLIHATGWQSFVNLLTFSAILGMIIESFMNMIQSLLWFSYWPDVFDMENIAVWFIATYIGYRFGASTAQRYVLLIEKKTQNKVV
jgi:uncharacterized integral membrane protein